MPYNFNSTTNDPRWRPTRALSTSGPIISSSLFEFPLTGRNPHLGPPVVFLSVAVLAVCFIIGIKWLMKRRQYSEHERADEAGRSYGRFVNSLRGSSRCNVAVVQVLLADERATGRHQRRGRTAASELPPPSYDVATKVCAGNLSTGETVAPPAYSQLGQSLSVSEAPRGHHPPAYGDALSLCQSSVDGHPPAIH